MTTPEETDTPPQEDHPTDLAADDHEEEVKDNNNDNDDPVGTDAVVQDIALHAMQVVEGVADADGAEAAEAAAVDDSAEVVSESAEVVTDITESAEAATADDGAEAAEEEEADNADNDNADNADNDNADNADNDNSATTTPKKKRLCRYPDCTRVIKSQGHCQRHGAKAKRCKVQGCDKQAQGTHDGMCKRHWKTIHFPQQPTTASQL